VIGRPPCKSQTTAPESVEQARATCERKADADFGPLRYLAAMIGAGDEATKSAFILAVCC
jgi:hypothetical protein